MEWEVGQKGHGIPWFDQTKQNLVFMDVAPSTCHGNGQLTIVTGVVLFQFGADDSLVENTGQHTYLKESLPMLG